MRRPKLVVNRADTDSVAVDHAGLSTTAA